MAKDASAPETGSEEPGAVVPPVPESAGTRGGTSGTGMEEPGREVLVLDGTGVTSTPVSTGVAEAGAEVEVGASAVDGEDSLSPETSPVGAPSR